MDDLISRKELLSRTIYNPRHAPYITKQDVEDMPSADVVEVVRCKDCIWNGGDCSWCTNPNLALGGDDASCLYIEPNWFCADGERKEKDDAEEIH